MFRKTRSQRIKTADVVPARRWLEEIPSLVAIDQMTCSLHANTNGTTAYATHDRPFITRDAPYSGRRAPTPSRPVIACSQMAKRLVKGVESHPFTRTLELAYAQHRPVALSPDIIWLLICQVVAKHINANAESLRHLFVSHPGKVALTVVRGPQDHFVKGSADNDWPGVVEDFSKEICARVGPLARNFRADFTTSGLVEKTVCNIVLMNSMQRYFEYKLVKIICGIPWIELEGSDSDWQSILERVEVLRPLQLDSWLNELRPILQQFLAASRGQVDHTFWRSIYSRKSKGDGVCVPDIFDGWYSVFLGSNTSSQTNSSSQTLMALRDQVRDALAAGTVSDRERQVLEMRLGLEDGQDHTVEGVARVLGVTRERIRQIEAGAIRKIRAAQGPHPSRLKVDLSAPTGMCSAPFTWIGQDLNGEEIYRNDMELLAGFVGIAQNKKTRCLRPQIGWAVREAIPAL